MYTAALILFFITIAQNASFTLVSRARNSGSLLYNCLASIGSNGIWLFVFRQLQASPNDWISNTAYITGAVAGSVLMQWIAMRFIEKKKPVEKKSLRKVRFDDAPEKLTSKNNGERLLYIWSDGYESTVTLFEAEQYKTVIRNLNHDEALVNATK